MKKLLIGVVVLIGLVIAASVFFLSKVDGLIAEAIKEEGSKALGVAVNVTAVKTDLKQGSANIRGLTIANPKGYQSPYAFQINNFGTKVDYQQKDIAEIIIDKPTITAEVNGTKSNFQDLVDNLPESAEEETSTSDNDDSDVEISIQLIKVTQATVDIISDVLGQQQFVMDDLVMRNLKGTPEALAEQVTSQLTQHVSSQVKGYLRQRVEDKVKAEIKEKVNKELNEKVNEKITEKLGGKLDGFKFNLK